MEELRTVGELARLAGVSVRTLHHYDAIGLLSPSGRTAAGYRAYSRAEVERLADILGYRGCGLSLADIAAVLDDGDRAAHLRRQRDLLDERIEMLNRQRAALERALEEDRMGSENSMAALFEVFGDDDPRQYADEAAARWGQTDAYRESERRTADYGVAEWTQAQAAGESVVAAFLGCLADGVPADSARAMHAAEEHRAQICHWYYPCSYDLHVELAQMYLADDRFTAYYDRHAPGLAQYVHDAILANAIANVE